MRGGDVAVDIATRYGLEGTGIESRWERAFPHPSRPNLGPIHPPMLYVPVSFPAVKRPGRGLDPSPTSSVEVKERVELYLSCCRETFTFSHYVFRVIN